MIALVAMGGFVLAGAIASWRLLRAESVGERLAALDVVLIALMGAVVVDAAIRDDTTNLVALVVLAIIGFTTVVAGSRFVEHRGQDPQADDGPLLFGDHEAER